MKTLNASRGFFSAQVTYGITTQPAIIHDIREETARLWNGKTSMQSNSLILHTMPNIARSIVVLAMTEVRNFQKVFKKIVKPSFLNSAVYWKGSYVIESSLKIHGTSRLDNHFYLELFKWTSKVDTPASIVPFFILLYAYCTGVTHWLYYKLELQLTLAPSRLTHMPT